MAEGGGGGVEDAADGGGCSVDYFLWAKPFLQFWGRFAAESGLVCSAAFRRLRRVRAHTAEDLLAHGAAGGVLDIVGNVVVAKEDLRRAAGAWSLRGLLGGGSLAAEASPCVFRGWPAGVFACRDEVVSAIHSHPPAKGTSSFLATQVVHPYLDFPLARKIIQSLLIAYRPPAVRRPPAGRFSALVARPRAARR